MRFNHIFGFLIILLAIYLGVNAGTDDVPDPIGPIGDGNGLVDEPGDGVNGGGNGGGGNGGGGNGNGGNGDAGDDRGDGNGGDGDGQRDGDRPRSNRARNAERAVANSRFCDAAPERSRFDDLEPAHDAAVRCMDAADVVQGRSADQFDPNDAVTRAVTASNIAAMIDRANALEAPGAEVRALPESADARFVDVAPDSPHVGAIARLNETPILEGYVDSRFEPTRPVTRAQMASILDRAYQYMNDAALPIGPDRFTDDERSVHEESINAVAAAGIMDGTSDRRFRPNRSVLRGQMASHLARIMVRMEAKGRIRPLP